MSEQNVFDKFGLEVKNKEIVLGDPSLVYGRITQILNDTPGEVVVIINRNLKLKLFLEDVERINIIKSRSLEPGIFVCTFDKKNENTTIEERGDSTEDTVFLYEGVCDKVVFGKKQEYDA